MHVQVDIIFSKVKPRDKRGIDVAGFVVALQLAANLRYPGGTLPSFRGVAGNPGASVLAPPLLLLHGCHESTIRLLATANGAWCIDRITIVVRRAAGVLRRRHR